jgi:hypothetical protein
VRPGFLRTGAISAMVAKGFSPGAPLADIMTVDHDSYGKVLRYGKTFG